MGEDKMKILVTGVSGFIGYHLSQKLLEKGYRVYGLVRFTSQKPKLTDIIPVIGDLTDYHSIIKAIQYIKPEIVFHLGAITPVSESYHQPVAYAQTNYIGTVNLLEAIRKYNYEKIRLVAVAGTTEMYHDLKWIDDISYLQPESPYAVSKVAEVLYSEYMYRAYNLPTVIVIPCNTYGRAYVNQPHFFIEKLIINMIKNISEIKLGNPNIVRDWIFREDHINAYLKILENIDNEETFGRRFYFGKGTGESTKQVFKTVKKLIGWNGIVKWGVYIRPRESKTMVINPEKANEILKWKTEYNLQSGLKKAIEEWREILK